MVSFAVVGGVGAGSLIKKKLFSTALRNTALRNSARDVSSSSDAVAKNEPMVRTGIRPLIITQCDTLALSA
jgi:hypothetical protein